MSHIKIKYALGGLDIDESHHMTIKCEVRNPPKYNDREYKKLT
jgi:hypothetical protein